MFKPFLPAYQTDRPMIPFLYGDLFKLLKNIFSIIIKPDIMNKCETALKLKEIDLYSSADHLVVREIDIGFVALTHIQELRRRDEVPKTCVLAFKKSVRKCVMATIEQLLERSPTGSVLVRNACVFNPEFITSANDESNLINKLKILVSHSIKHNWIDPQYGDRVVLQYKSFLQNELKLHHEKLTLLKEVKIVLMSFFSTFEVHKNYEELSSVIKIILVLSHGRSFSLEKSFIVENISEESIRNKKLIKDHMLANNITPSTIQITKKMQTDYKCAWTKYEIYLEHEKKKGKIENDNRKSIISEEINGVKTLIIEKEKTRGFLEKENFLAMQDAEKKNDMSFVKKATVLKRSRDETDDEIKTLQKTLVSLEDYNFFGDNVFPVS